MQSRGRDILTGLKPPDFVVFGKGGISDKIDELFASYPVTGGTSVGSGAHEVNVSADNLRRLEEDFINIIGPIGMMMLEGIYSDIGHRRGTDIPARRYSRLLYKLKDELPIQHRTTFAAKYAIGLALTNTDK